MASPAGISPFGDDSPSDTRELNFSSIDWPARPWWMLLASQDQWRAKLQSDVTKTLSSSTVRRDLTTDELEAMADLMAAGETWTSATRYATATFYPGAVLFYARARAHPLLAFGRNSALVRALPPTAVAFFLFGLVFNTVGLSRGRSLSESPRLQAYRAEYRAAHASQDNMPRRGPAPLRHGAPPMSVPAQPRRAVEPTAAGRDDAEAGKDMARQTGSYDNPVPSDDRFLRLYEQQRARIEKDIDYFSTGLRKIAEKEARDGKSLGLLGGMGKKLAESTLESRKLEYSRIVAKENTRRQELGLPTLPPREFEAATTNSRPEEAREGSDDFNNQSSGQYSGAGTAETDQRWDTQPTNTQGSEQPSEWGAEAWARRGEAPPPQPPPSTRDGDDWDPLQEVDGDGPADHDASAVAPAERRRPRPQPTGPPGSAWARVRQQSLPNDDQPPQPPTQGGGAGWGRRRPGGGAQDDLSYSRAEEERATTKEQAQKEFDAMVDRERRGEADDKKPSGGWNKWS